MFRASLTGRPGSFGVPVRLVLLWCAFLTPVVAKTPSQATPPHSALGGFVKDAALARVLGETLFKDTVDVMSDAPPPPPSPAAASDNSAVGQVARTVLASRSLDKYLWLIRRSFDDSLWKGGDRARIEQHFPLIWRTSILLYESTLNASPQRVRVCSPTDDVDTFDCRDEIERAKIVPIPAQAPMLVNVKHPQTG